MTRSMSLFRKSLLLISIPSIFNVVFISVMFSRQAGLEDSQKWVVHTKEVIAAAHEMLEVLCRSRMALQFFMFRGNPESRAEIPALDEEAQNRLNYLRKMVGDNPTQEQRLADLDRLMIERRVWASHLIEVREKEGLDGALKLILTNEGQKNFLKVRDTVLAFVAQEEELDTQRTEHLRQTTNVQRMILIGGAIVILVLTPLIVVLFYQSIGRRISLLIDNTKRIISRQPLNPILVGNDEIVDLDRTLHDMSDQLYDAEAKEKDYKEELRQRAEQLAKTNAEMQVTNTENEQFVYTVSHDLRSPLVNLQGFSKELMLTVKDLHDAVKAPEVPESVRERLKIILDRDVKESVTFIQAGVTRLANIIDALLRLSRAGRVEYKMQPVEMNPIIKRVVTSLDGTIRDRGAKVTVQPDLPPALTDAAAVEQILGNLAGNALNYLEPKRPGEIYIGVKENSADGLDPDSNVYYVRDNGMGIAEAHLKKVFVAFQRLHPQAAQGEGIGLALVKRTVDRLGGKIWVESEAGKGTTFFVGLPKVKNEVKS